MTETRESILIEPARSRLGAIWNSILGGASMPPVDALIPNEVLEAIRRSINSKSKTYRYVLPTQLLAKVIRPDLDCMALQAGSKRIGAFDARSLCHKVVVPFDQANECVLGGSEEPYASNPLRVRSLREKDVGNQKNKKGLDDLRLVLQFAQDNADAAEALLIAVLYEIRERLTKARFTYPVPNRSSAAEALRILKAFLKERSGGMRLQTVSVAFFQTIGTRFGLFRAVASKGVNAADASTGQIADLECRDADGELMLAVEVKDTRLTLTEVQSKLPRAREAGIRELIFMVQGGMEANDESAIVSIQEHEFGAGLNLYVCEFMPFMQTCLALLGEEGRRVFLLQVGKELDGVHADLSHKQSWKELLETL